MCIVTISLVCKPNPQIYALCRLDLAAALRPTVQSGQRCDHSKTPSMLPGPTYPKKKQPRCGRCSKAWAATLSTASCLRTSRRRSTAKAARRHLRLPQLHHLLRSRLSRTEARRAIWVSERAVSTAKRIAALGATQRSHLPATSGLQSEFSNGCSSIELSSTAKWL